MRAIASLTVAMLLMQGCFIYVGVNDEEGKGRDNWHDWNDDDDDDTAFDSGDTAAPALQVDVTISPGTVAAGEAAIVELDIDGDVGSDDLVDVWFDTGIDVLDVVWRDGDVIVAISVAADVSGTVGITLDFGDDGVVSVPAVLTVTPAGGAAPGGGHDSGAGDGSGDGEVCP